jgi:hypothetical protein
VNAEKNLVIANPVEWNKHKQSRYIVSIAGDGFGDFGVCACTPGAAINILMDMLEADDIDIDIIEDCVSIKKVD